MMRNDGWLLPICVHLSKFKYLPVLLLLISCKPGNADRAEIGRYYFDTTNKSGNNDGAELFSSVVEGIEEFDYFLTEESAANGWPYYGAVPVGDPVKKSDLMPPHTWVHRLLPLEEFSDGLDGPVFKSEFVLYTFNDTLVEVGAINYALRNNNWDHLITTVTAKHDPRKYNKEDLILLLRKTLIRDTFK